MDPEQGIPRPSLQGSVASTDVDSSDSTLSGSSRQSLEKPAPLPAADPVAELTTLSLDEPLPPIKPMSYTRYVILSCYRRLFSLVFLGNLAAFIYIMATDKKLDRITDAAVANLLALGLARHPVIINICFATFCGIPRWAPLFVRRLACKVYCIGGVHSGCGVASFTWYCGFISLLTKQYVNQTEDSPIKIMKATIGIAWVVFALQMAIIIAAYPKLRSKLHDYFEFTHRFSGWAVVALFWPLLITYGISVSRGTNQTLGHFLVVSPTFWLVILASLAIIHPWLLLRRVPVRAEVLSSHAVRLHFTHTAVNSGQGLSLSKHPLRDWHSFAGFPDTPAVKGVSGTTKENPDFSCVVSKAGDWTSDTIANPPKYLWKRAVPVYGFGYVMKIFKRVIIATTGSGIGPCLSYLGDFDRPAMRVVWQTRAPEATYGKEVVGLVHLMDANPLILDSSKSGKRVDMLPLVIKLHKEFEAEAVCVISNPFMTAKLVYELEARGIYAFGPIFDS